MRRHYIYIYVDLLEETPSTSAEGESGFTFKASRGWFGKFNTNVESIVLTGMERRVSK